MSFYSKLEFNQDDMYRTYTIRTSSGNVYEFEKGTANLKIDSEDNMIIFTNKDNYRIALNCAQIESVKWDAN